MERASETVRPAINKWGWAIMFAAGALVAVEGVALYLNLLGVLERALEKDAALLITVIGVQSIAAAVAGLRTGARWAWNAGWVLLAVLVGVGVIHTIGGEPSVGVLHLAVAAAVLVAQLLAARGLQR